MKRFSGNKLLSAVMSLFLGALVPLGFAPFGLFVVPIVVMALWLLLLRDVQPGRAAWYGWFFGLGMFGVGVNWIHISIHEYGNASFPLAILVTFVFVAFISLFTALVAWVCARFRTRSRGLDMLLLYPSIWVMTEWVRSWLFTGFPWLNLGYSQIDSWLSASAPIGGVYATSWLMLFVSGLVALFLVSRNKVKLFSVFMLGVVWASCWQLQKIEWSTPIGEPFQASLIQGNIPQDMKWRIEEQQATLQHYLELTATQKNSRLIVWPETAIPAYYDQVEESFIEPLRQELMQKNVSLVTGIPVLDRNDWKYYNAVISLSDPQHRYFKQHLVPFGEYLPLRNWLVTILNFLPIPEADFSAGRHYQPLLTAAGYPFSSSICYEIAFGEQLLRDLPEAAWLINVSNDAWFGDSLAPHQHLEMARMRALETGRYLLRSTNTGISAGIDQKGRVIARTQQFKAEALPVTITPMGGITPYVHFGNWPVVILCLIVIFGIGGYVKKHSQF
ncbi:MAG: apolipoprotein N-acyltransferase [Gammaproteobacteria bacterium]